MQYSSISPFLAFQLYDTLQCFDISFDWTIISTVRIAFLFFLKLISTLISLPLSQKIAES